MWSSLHSLVFYLADWSRCKQHADPVHEAGQDADVSSAASWDLWVGPSMISGIDENRVLQLAVLGWN
jgi:hypothetical protein